MRKTTLLIAQAALGLALTMAVATPAAAGLCTYFPSLCGVTIPRTPEIDPSLLRGTLTLLVGGVLVLADRRRRRG